jgi:hypothetical protein
MMILMMKTIDNYDDDHDDNDDDHDDNDKNNDDTDYNDSEDTAYDDYSIDNYRLNG